MASLAMAVTTVQAQALPPNPNGPSANWAQYEKFSTANVRTMSFSTTITPRWIGETDSVFYSWRDHSGERWYLVNALTRAKKPLFDHAKLAAQLSVLRKKAVDANALNDQFSLINITKDHKHLRFAVDSERYNWNIVTETLTSLGRFRGAQDSLMTKDEEVDQVLGIGGGRGGGGRGAAPPQAGRGAAPEFRNWAPDSSAFVFARNYNLYLWEKAKGDTVQITRDGIEKYSYAGGGRGGGGQLDTTQLQQQEDNQLTGASAANRPSRPTVNWSQDSKAFHLTRTDNRGVKEMYLVRSLTEPRPTLLSYSYPMPGEDSIPKPEIWTYIRGDKEAKRAPLDKWRDQRIVASGQVGVTIGGGRGGGGGAAPPAGPGYWMGKTGTTIRVVRRDRLQRNVEFVELDIATGQSKVLFSDTKGDAGSLELQGPTYVKTGGDFLWFSERDGWGHYYLYSYDGKLKRQLTSGPWRADAIIAIDSIKGFAYIRGQGREPGENLYNTHLYKVSLADASISLLDPGNASHTSVLSKNQRWIIDQSSRVDTVPRVQLRDAITGKLALDLETADLSKLQEAGWKFPETFQTLAADGVTPIFGNMWKPFDFDSTKKYPIIAHVYPGPQTESVTGAFSGSPAPQQLAQLGFIVIQIGNRGGTPARSGAYQDFSYFDMRDYALADKKTGIEQLASRHKWIDLDRVGIFGHSGGGFLTAAALLLPPYNEFFKVGVSESGNHDNNIYNNNWSEQYHGLKWVAASDTARLTAEARSKGRSADFVAGAAVATTQLGGRGTVNGRGGVQNGGRGGGGGVTGGRGATGADSTAAARPAGAPAAVPDSVFWIYVPTNIDIANNLKGKLLLETGDEDNNVSPSNTIRLVNALIQSGKRFDYMIYPGQPHAYGPMAPYAYQLQAEYFAEFLLGDRSFRMSADFKKHRP
ncbi:MAG: DPP IV N-terminal domain-containing protein [Gemmatimonadaceae bacterium]|nr:DPP IV N-terminal domain-containing protein [Gemmatimonadaceae bacterium]